jgi:hypothetical protein
MKAPPAPIRESVPTLERRARTDPERPRDPGATEADRPRARKGLSIEDAGLEMLFLFTVAAFAVVGAVWLTGSVESWWILLPAMGIHLTATAAVLVTLWHLAGDGEEPDDPDD